MRAWCLTLITIAACSDRREPEPGPTPGSESAARLRATVASCQGGDETACSALVADCATLNNDRYRALREEHAEALRAGCAAAPAACATLTEACACGWTEACDRRDGEMR